MHIAVYRRERERERERGGRGERGRNEERNRGEKWARAGRRREGGREIGTYVSRARTALCPYSEEPAGTLYIPWTVAHAQADGRTRTCIRWW